MYVVVLVRWIGEEREKERRLHPFDMVPILTTNYLLSHQERDREKRDKTVFVYVLMLV